MNKIVFVLFFVSTLFITSCVSDTSSDTIGYQIHSFNDLRQWPQLLQRGAQVFKVDVQYMTASDCESIGLSADSRGCLPMVHNSIPSPPPEVQPFNFENLLFIGAL